MNTGSSTVQNNETSTSGEVIPEAWYKAMWQLKRSRITEAGSGIPCLLSGKQAG